MSHAHVLWVDLDTGHADAARRRVAAFHPGWHLVTSPTPQTAIAPLASQAWDAVVLCLAPSDRELPCLLELCAGHPVLLCLEPAQEALAARAFRCGLGDYVLRQPDGVAHLGELCSRLGALLQDAKGQGQGQPLRMVDDGIEVDPASGAAAEADDLPDFLSGDGEEDPADDEEEQHMVAAE